MSSANSPVPESRPGLRIAFLQQYCVELLGVMHLSASLRREGHLTRLFIQGLERDLLDAVVGWHPDVLGIQITTGQHLWALDLLPQMLARLPKLRIVLGGPHATFVPEIIERGNIDAVVRGEGEGPLVELCSALRDGRDWTEIAGTWTRDDHGVIHRNAVAAPVQDLDGLPFPDRELVYRYPQMRQRLTKSFMGGRGCGQPCSFCHNHAAMRLFRGLGPWVRRRSPELFVREIENVRDFHGPLGVVNLENDDDLLSHPAWYEEFFALYRERVGLPFFIMTRADHITPRAVRLIREAGCVAVSLALETANDELRQTVLRKNFSKAQFLTAMEEIHRGGLRSKVYNMVGIPGERIENSLETLDLNLEVKPTWAMCSVLQPYPGTDLRRQCLDAGILKAQEHGDEFSPLFFKESVLDLPEIDLMINLQRLFAITVQFPVLRGTIEHLMRLPRNRIFDAMAKLMYGLQGANSYQLSLGETIRLANCSRERSLKRRW